MENWKPVKDFEGIYEVSDLGRSCHRNNASYSLGEKMKLRFKDILSNPFRDLKANPLIEAKVQELMVSINLTGYWQNVVVTKREGSYCLAYGHHRIEAAKRCGLTEADFIVMDLDDAKLIQVLDNENRETYGSSPASVIESVKAVVAALADGTIPAFKVDPKTNVQHIRYAPSYIAGASSRTDASIPYTSTLIAEFLGRTYPNGRADTAVEAALNFLHLKEMGAINNSVLVKDNQPITARKLFDITADLKKRTEAVQERRGKTAAEIAEYREQQLELQRKQKEQEKEAEEARKALLKKEADARREENNRKADELAAKRKDADERAKAKAALNAERVKQLDEKIAQKKAWEKEQCVQDEYASIRRDVEATMRRLENIVSEHNPFRDEVKSLAKLRKLKAEDRERLRQAALTVSTWYQNWVAVQFLPLPTVKQELAEMVKKEKAKESK